MLVGRPVMQSGSGPFGSGGAPLISCLLVTLPVPERLPLLQRSIADYRRQTWHNRELVIVSNGGDPDSRAAITACVNGLAQADIRLVEVPGALRLGALRNISIAEARGEVVCQWDDDDRYHPERLARQVEAMRADSGRANLLQEVMQYFVADGLLFCTNWHGTDSRGKPGSLMCLRAESIAYDNSGPGSAFGEDRLVVQQLLADGRLGVLAGAPHLFIYVVHGHNSWNDSHHRMLVKRLAVSRGVLLRQEAALRAGLAAFDFGAAPVTVQGYNGAAFKL
jgi:glycosyltransferase involved in cell wall biosynthesis